MHWSEVRWGAVIGLVVLAEVLLISTAVLYMVIYGHFNPGHPEDFYQSHARVASPWVSITAGVPIFFLFARWLSRRGIAASAVALWVIWVVLDTSILIAADGAGAIGRVLPFWIASLASKLLSVWAGVWFQR
jgi:hypothetical protein